MMGDTGIARSRSMRLLGGLVIAMVTGLLLAAGLCAASLGLVSILADNASVATWAKRSNAGEAMQVLSGIFSGLGFIALIATLLIQSRDHSDTELYRSAETDLRRLHVQLMEMAINDTSLATVWPELVPGLPAAQNRQYLYANLIFWHLQLRLSLGNASEEQVKCHLRYLFTSPLMRGYWMAAENARNNLIKGTNEWQYCELARQVFNEPWVHDLTQRGALHQPDMG